MKAFKRRNRKDSAWPFPSSNRVPDTADDDSATEDETEAKVSTESATEGLGSDYFYEKASITLDDVNETLWALHSKVEATGKALTQSHDELLREIYAIKSAMPSGVTGLAAWLCLFVLIYIAIKL